MTGGYEPGPDLARVISLIVALEGACTTANALKMLPYLGMARSEIVDCGFRLSAPVEQIPIDSFDDGLARLNLLLGQMRAEPQDLVTTLRVLAAQELLREGMTARQRGPRRAVVRDEVMPVASPQQPRTTSSRGLPDRRTS